MKLSVVIATIYDPWTLDLLVSQAEAGGHEVIVVKGRPVNWAWNEGVRKATTDNIVILNDDIEVNRDFFDGFVREFEDGYEYMVAAHVSHFGPAGNWDKKVLPPDKGHAFAFTRPEMPPIPEEFLIYYGDDWFFWNSVCDKRKHCCATLAQYRTGVQVGINKYQSGFTLGHEGFDDLFYEMTGVTRMEQTRLEHGTFRHEYFKSHLNVAPDPKTLYCGPPTGLVHKELQV